MTMLSTVLIVLAAIAGFLLGMVAAPTPREVFERHKRNIAKLKADFQASHDVLVAASEERTKSLEAFMADVAAAKARKS